MLRLSLLALLFFGLTPCVQAQLVVPSAPYPGNGAPSGFTEVDGVFYFAASEEAVRLTPRKLFSYDPSTGQSRQIVLGSGRDSIRSLIAYQGEIYVLIARYSTTRYYRIDMMRFSPATGQTRVIVLGVREHSHSGELLGHYNGRVFFMRSLGTPSIGQPSQGELAAYDPQTGAVETVFVPDQDAHRFDPFGFLTTDDHLVFHNYSFTNGVTELFAYSEPDGDRSNGSVTRVALPEYADVRDIVSYAGALYFRMVYYYNVGSPELWRYDIVSRSIERVWSRDDAGALCAPEPADLRSVVYAKSHSGLTVYRDALYFPGTHPALGSELCRYDAATGEATLVADLYPGPESGSPASFQVMGDRLLFTAHRPETGHEVFGYDGTTNTVELVADLVAGSVSSAPTELVASGDHLLASALSDANGHELFTIDPGSGAGRIAADLFPGDAEIPRSIGERPNPYNLTAIGSTLYFTSVRPTTGREVFVYKPDKDETELVSELVPGPGGVYKWRIYSLNGALHADVGGFLKQTQTVVLGADTTFSRTSWNHTSDVSPVQMGESIYFYSDDQALGGEVFVFDGVSGTTRLLADLAPGSASTTLKAMAAYKGVLYLGTHLGLYAHDPASGEVEQLASVDVCGGEIEAIGNRLYFAASASREIGCELYRYDLDDGSFELVADLNSGGADARPAALTAHDGVLYFRAQNAGDYWYGPERLIRHDPVTGITELAAPATNPALYGSIVPFDGLLFVTGRGGDDSLQFMVYDPTSGQLNSVLGIEPDSSWEAVVAGNRLYVTARHDTGVGIYAIDAGTRVAQPVALSTPTDRLVVFPNPVVREATLVARTQHTQPVRIVVYDALGREVVVLFDGVLAAGQEHQIRLDASPLPAGTYMVRSVSRTAIKTQLFVVTR